MAAKLFVRFFDNYRHVYKESVSMEFERVAKRTEKQTKLPPPDTKSKGDVQPQYAEP
jgi:hypothetical protein